MVLQKIKLLKNTVFIENYKTETTKGGFGRI